MKQLQILRNNILILIKTEIETLTNRYDSKFEENYKNSKEFNEKIVNIEQKVDRIDQEGVFKIKKQEEHLESHERQLNDFIASHKINIKKEMYNVH